MWYAKMYFSGKKEVFQYDAAGIQGVPSTERELPFLESLLSFLEMGWDELTPSLRKIADSWERLITEDDRQAGTDAMVELGAIKDRHIYLELLFVRWYDRFARMGICYDRGGAEDRQMFFNRTSSMLMKMFEYMLRTHTEEAACVTHGGVIMNMLSQHALPFRKPEEWMTDPGAGYSVRLDAEMWMRDHLAEAYDVVPHGYLDAFEQQEEQG